ncbi:MAG: hypothetical protein H0V40_07915 [Actinobacteria bacterium]|nr:hypothetical protein [Actinomycetota bacterium]
MEPRTLDHVALWLADRDAVSSLATASLGMHVVDRTERFTLVGSDARHGKLTLFAADGPRERGALKHIALRVSALDAAAGALPPDLDIDSSQRGTLLFDVSEGVRLGLVEAPTEVEYDLDHVALWSRAPARTAQAYTRLGFRSAETGPSGAPRVEVGGAYVEFHDGDPGKPESPLLHHLAVLVDSAESHLREAEELGVEVDDFVDAPNTLAVFLRGPEGVRIEYVEHKPGFSLT